MILTKTWLLALGLLVSGSLAVSCAVPIVSPPPATPTPASEFLEKPQPVLVKEPLVPSPANEFMADEGPTPAPPEPERQVPTPAPSPPALCATVVNTDFLNVRSSPAATSNENLVGVVQADQTFGIIGTNSDGTWYQVEIPDILGDTWLFTNYVREGACP